MARESADDDTAGAGTATQLYQDSDGLRHTAPWIIRDYQELGALSDGSKTEIAERFDLDPALVQDLSVLIGNSLDVDSVVSMARVSSKVAVKRGHDALQTAARLARRMRSDRAGIERQLSRLGTNFDQTGQGTLLLYALQEDLVRIGALVDALETRIDDLVRVEGGVAVMAPDDTRKARDMRRTHVVRSCCYIWEDAGRPVTYTTVSHEPGASQRRGALIELINAVTRQVTDPPTELPGETLRRDIDQFRALRKAGRI